MGIQPVTPLERFKVLPQIEAGVDSKVVRLKLTVVAGLLSGFFLSHNLWLSSRFYPLTPIFSVFKLGFPFDYLLFATLLSLLALIAVTARPARWIFAFLVLAVLSALFDQSRLQPWFYQYLFMLAAIGLSFANTPDHKSTESALNICRLIIVCVYFWSGLLKANPVFVQTTFPWLLRPWIGALPAAAIAWLRPLALAAPMLEMGIAIGLLTTKFRNAAVAAAVVMHSFILASIGPFGRDYNDVVWPWNIVMIVSVILLFWRAREPSAKSVLWYNKFAFQKLVLVLFALTPALSLVNRWDNYLSFALYSGNRNTATIQMATLTATRLPEDVQELLSEDETQNSGDSDSLSISDWSWQELNVPAYPEMRIFKNIGRQICGIAGTPADLKLNIQGKQSWFSPAPQFVYSCADLSK